MRKIIPLLVIISLLFVPLNTKGLTTSDVQPVLVIGGTKGSENGQFNEPDSVYVSSEGLIYAGDTNNLRVQIFDQDGVWQGELTGFTPTSQVVGNEVQGIGELNNGTIVVVEKAGYLYFFNPTDYSIQNKINLKTLANLTTVDTQGLAVNPELDLIYITNQPEFLMIVVNADGTLNTTWDVGLFSTPENIAVDTDRDRIYVSAEGQGKIYVFAYNGTKIDEFGKEYVGFNYEGLAIDPLGNILAVDEGPDSGTSSESRIIVFSPDNYTALYAWGGTPGNGNGRFLSPDGIAYDPFNHRVLIADQGNYRIQIFDYIEILNNGNYHGDTEGPVIEGPQDVNGMWDQSMGSKDMTLTWTISGEIFGGTYELFKDGQSVESGEFSDKGEVSVTLTVTGPMNVTYELKATDAFGNTASDVVTIGYAEQKQDKQVTTETTVVQDAPFPAAFFIFTLVAIPVIQRKLKKLR